jgi:hypothetical protein
MDVEKGKVLCKRSACPSDTAKGSYHRITPQRHSAAPRHAQKTRENKKATAIPLAGIRPVNCSPFSLA